MPGGGADNGVPSGQDQMPTKQDLTKDAKGQEQMPSKEDLMKAAEAAKTAQGLQAAAMSIRAKITQFTNPKERERWLQEAYKKEIEANGQSKMAKRLASGPWQGAGGGAGIGGAVGMGVGTVVGTVVGGVTAIPTTLIGGGVGAGVGAFHGPFIKLGGGDKQKDGKGQGQDASEEAAESKPPEQVRQEEELDAAIAQQDAQPSNIELSSDQSDEPEPTGEQTPKGKRKPRKLQVRS
ncbi:hypothetical protein M8818_002077 [Zalaria obscura]|uniref:Uncharacterized protein n=1 Tax=Zalaria obscura TaxID=2024903 RepID=A0ACC3SIW2_9PEZI